MFTRSAAPYTCTMRQRNKKHLTRVRSQLLTDDVISLVDSTSGSRATRNGFLRVCPCIPSSNALHPGCFVGATHGTRYTTGGIRTCRARAAKRQRTALNTSGPGWTVLNRSRIASLSRIVVNHTAEISACVETSTFTLGAGFQDRACRSEMVRIEITLVRRSRECQTIGVET